MEIVVHSFRNKLCLKSQTSAIFLILVCCTFLWRINKTDNFDKMFVSMQNQSRHQFQFLLLVDQIVNCTFLIIFLFFSELFDIIKPCLNAHRFSLCCYQNHFSTDTTSFTIHCILNFLFRFFLSTFTFFFIQITKMNNFTLPKLIFFHSSLVSKMCQC